MTDIEPADVRAMREQGDMRAYLRQLIATGRDRGKSAPAPTTDPDPHGIPGAWPPRSRPPHPIPTTPPEAWETALQRLRTGTQTGTRCECPGCNHNTSNHPDA
ncbi:hypothetical protein ACIOD1_12805 [Streptomyces sp. NPDC088097]|uniref:hypothetical protein n=1 Tax=Streptomyces sp. NPDC088097 TaxID=3365823 RepID=UPI0038074063